MMAEERPICIVEGKEFKAELAEMEEELVHLEAKHAEEAARVLSMVHPDAPRGSEDKVHVLSTVGQKLTKGVISTPEVLQCSHTSICSPSTAGMILNAAVSLVISFIIAVVNQRSRSLPCRHGTCLWRVRTASPS